MTEIAQAYLGRGSKQCSRCHEIKPIHEFSLDKGGSDGHRTDCKACRRAYRKRYYQANRTKVQAKARAYRARNLEASRERCRQYRRKHRERLGEQNRRYYRAHAKGIIARNRQYQDENPERYAAHRAVASAIRRGDLIRLPCAHCGSPDNIDAHIEDYSKPLDVVWLCRRCHSRLHAAEREHEHAMPMRG